MGIVGGIDSGFTGGDIGDVNFDPGSFTAPDFEGGADTILMRGGIY